MVWTKLDEDFDDDCADVQMTDAAFRTHVQGLLFTMRRLTGGWVPDRAVARMDTADPEAAAEELCNAGIWRRVPGGYHVIHHMEWQPTREVVEARKAADAARQAKARKRKAEDARSNAEAPSRRESRRDDTRDSQSVTTGRVGAGRGGSERDGPGLEELPAPRKIGTGPPDWPPVSPPGGVDLSTGEIHQRGEVEQDDDYLSSLGVCLRCGGQGCPDCVDSMERSAS